MNSRYLLCAQIVLLLLAFSPAALQILAVYVYVNPISLDGKFQTYGIVELLSGSGAPFRDFPVYLGLWVMKLIASMRWFFGDNLLGIQQAAIALSGIAFSTLIVFLLVAVGAPSRAWPVLLAVSAVTPILLDRIGSRTIGLTVLELAIPGNSLLSIRCFGVTVAAIAVLVSEQTFGRRIVFEQFGRPLLWGLLAGLLLLWSNDFGLGTAVVLPIALLLWMQRPLRFVALLVNLLLFSAAAIPAVLVGTALAGASLMDWWASSFVATAGDQFWLFYPWAEHSRAFSLLDIVSMAFGIRLLSYDVSTALLIIICVAVHTTFLLSILFSRKKPGPRKAALMIASMASWAGALIATVGGHFWNHYWALFQLLTPFLGFTLLRPWLKLAEVTFPPIVVWNRVLSVGVAAVVSWIAEAALLQTKYGPPLRQIVDKSLVSAEFGGWEVGLKPADAAEDEALKPIARVLDRCVRDRSKRLVESYSSLVGVRLGSITQPDAISLISVLGEDARERYLSLMRDKRPVLATTIAEDYSPWAAWGIRARWFWFEPLLAHYLPVARTRQHIFWLRADPQPSERVAGQCRIEQLSPALVRLSFEAPPGAGDWAVASVSYATTSSAKSALLRPMHQFVTVSEIDTLSPPPLVAREAQTAFSYGLPSQAKEQPVVFRGKSAKSQLELKSTPEDHTNIVVSSCAVTFGTLPFSSALPSLSDAADLPAKVEASACLP